MFDGAALRNNLAGAWALMNGRPEGLALLDVSLEGFWRSFVAIVLILPFAALTVLGERVVVAGNGEQLVALTGGLIAAHAVTLLVDWLAFPLVFAALARPLGLGGRYVPFIVARNWGAVIATAVAALANGLIVLGIVPAGAAPFLLLFVLGLALRFAYCIARTTLAVPLGFAIPIVILDVLLSLVVHAALGPATTVQPGG